MTTKENAECLHTGVAKNHIFERCLSNRFTSGVSILFPSSSSSSSSAIRLIQTMQAGLSQHASLLGCLRLIKITDCMISDERLSGLKCANKPICDLSGVCSTSESWNIFYKFQAASNAYFRNVSIIGQCKAVARSSVHTFAHYISLTWQLNLMLTAEEQHVILYLINILQDLHLIELLLLINFPRMGICTGR